jgi:signal peptidase I
MAEKLTGATTGGSQADQAGDQPPRRRGGLSGFIRETVILMVLAVGLAVIFKTFLVQAFYIPSSSMEPTLQISDRVLVEKLSYRFGEIDHGDVIVFLRDGDPFAAAPPSNPVARLGRSVAEAVGLAPPLERDFIKRVIGLPGDELECRDGQVVRNGEVLDEPYVMPGSVTDCAPVTVAPGQVYVFGDNRENSQDSRVFGAVDEDDVVGKAFVRIWPLNRVGLPG